MLRLRMDLILINHMNSNKRYWSIVATIVGITVFVVIIFILHFIQPDYNPKYQLISELAIGKYGALVFIAFSGLAAAVFGLQIAIGGQEQLVVTGSC